MADPFLLSPSAVDAPTPEVHAAEIIDNAAEPDDEVRAVVPEFGPELATDPMRWQPYIAPAGFFYPKRGDRAIVGYPPDGEPAILAWWPSAPEPDVAL